MSSVSFQLVYFVPDAFRDERSLIGSLVTTTAGSEFVPSEALPREDCIGGFKSRILMRSILQSLRPAMSASDVVVAGGLHVKVGPEFPAPPGVGEKDAADWIQQSHLRRDLTESSKTASSGRMMRASYGMTFFKTYDLDSVVRKTWAPKREGAGWLDDYRGVLKPITHWVQGASNLLLMEPIAPIRGDMEKQAEAIASRFLAYRGVFMSLREENLFPNSVPTPKFYSYLLPGGGSDTRSAVSKMLRPVTDRAWDVDFAAERERFVEVVRRNAPPNEGGLMDHLGE